MPGALRRLVIFGAFGDLTSRLLVPALAELAADDRLPDGFALVGIDRVEADEDGFRRRLAEGLDAHAAETDATARRRVLDAARYARADVTDAAAVAAAVGADGDADPFAAYLALPPALVPGTVEALHDADTPAGCRVVCEKPFGTDLESARRLNALLHREFPEDAVYRIDHFLGMQTVQNLLGLRFANRLLEPVWSSQHVERVDIVWDETLALEGRASYYDSSGALRDVLQNHLLQILCFVAMEPPTTLDARDVRDRKVELLRAVERLSSDGAAARTVRGRYTAGRIGDRDIPSYVDEEGVDPSRGTETYAEVTLHVDNWRWSGVPFRLRHGKALGDDRREVVVRFRRVPHLPFGTGTDAPRNQLRIALAPERLALDLAVNDTGEDPGLDRVVLDTDLAREASSPYARVLRAVLDGDPTLSIRDDEAEAGWAIMEPVLTAWEAGRVPLADYPAGSDGPRA